MYLPISTEKSYNTIKIGETMQTLKDQVVDYLDGVIKDKINLMHYANYYGIPVYVNGNLDKGWKGNVVEHLLNLKKNNHKGADFYDLEIKTVPVTGIIDKWKVKETTCLSVLDTNDIIKYSFEESSLYNKIKKTLFVLIDTNDKDNPYICKTYYMDLEKLLLLKEDMKNDYNLVCDHIVDNIQCDLPLDTNFTGKLGKVIQPRPKTGKKGGYTWAFYLKTPVLTDLLNQELLLQPKEDIISRLKI